MAIFLANAGLSPPTLDATAMTSFLQVGGAYFGFGFFIHSTSTHVRHLSGSRYLLRNSSNLLVEIPKPMPMLYHLKVRLHTARQTFKENRKKVKITNWQHTQSVWISGLQNSVIIICHADKCKCEMIGLSCYHPQNKLQGLQI